ncbi:4-oxalocrotonate tautomerase DmpI [Methanobrevibacter sp. DSM 116169]|uniref:4-oxalocrotonate tautomerase DmpI n=1 Tax=Methanobrevibacter sp. DSM 116169 TaxID=3242727 RepID=UPI0038FD36D1
MPVVTISGNNTINKENKNKMVHEVTKVVANAYNLPESAITILIEEYPAENVGVGGKLLSDLK